MFNNGLHAMLYRKSQCVWVLGLIAGAILMPASGQADSRADLKELKPETRESVRNIGQALLRARRAYKPDQNIAALRDDIDEIRRLLNLLTEPSVSAQIRLEPSANTSSGTRNLNKPSVPPSMSWRQARAPEIDRLRNAMSNLKKQSRMLREKLGRAKASPSILDAIARFFTGAQQGAGGSHAIIMTPVTDTALSRLERLDTEVEAALALPAAERRRHLHDLVAALNIGSSRQRLRKAAEKTVSPTLSSRTKHRRTW